MSQMGNQCSSLVDMVADQVKNLSNPILSLDDINHLNGILLKAYLQAGATVLQGVTDALQTVISRTETRLGPPEGARKVVVE